MDTIRVLHSFTPGVTFHVFHAVTCDVRHSIRFCPTLCEIFDRSHILKNIMEEQTAAASMSPETARNLLQLVRDVINGGDISMFDSLVELTSDGSGQTVAATKAGVITLLKELLLAHLSSSESDFAVRADITKLLHLLLLPSDVSQTPDDTTAAGGSSSSRAEEADRNAAALIMEEEAEKAAAAERVRRKAVKAAKTKAKKAAKANAKEAKTHVACSSAVGPSYDCTTKKLLLSPPKPIMSARPPSILEEDDQSCSVCLDKPASILLAPCGHTTLCQDCCKDIRAADKMVSCFEIFKTQSSTLNIAEHCLRCLQCPLCRCIIEGTVDTTKTHFTMKWQER